MLFLSAMEELPKQVEDSIADTLLIFSITNATSLFVLN